MRVKLLKKIRKRYSIVKSEVGGYVLLDNKRKEQVYPNLKNKVFRCTIHDCIIEAVERLIGIDAVACIREKRNAAFDKARARRAYNKLINKV